MRVAIYRSIFVVVVAVVAVVAVVVAAAAVHFFGIPLPVMTSSRGRLTRTLSQSDEFLSDHAAMFPTPAASVASVASYWLL